MAKAEKKHYRVHGWVKNWQTTIDEYVHAYSPNQALKIIAIRLAKRERHLVEPYLGECKAEIVMPEKKVEPAKPNPEEKKQGEKQLALDLR